MDQTGRAETTAAAAEAAETVAAAEGPLTVSAELHAAIHCSWLLNSGRV